MEIIDLWTLRVDHDYYQDKRMFYLDVQISEDMRRLLARRCLIWRKKSFNEWCLSSFGRNALDDEDVLRLELRNMEKELPYVTDLKWPVGNECYEVSVPVAHAKIVAKECVDNLIRGRGQSGFMKLSVPLGKMVNQGFCPSTTCLSFQAVCKYWEYFLIDRQHQNNRLFRLEDSKNSIRFGEAEMIHFMGHDVLRIRSLEKVPLCEHYPNMDLALWELVLTRGGQREYVLSQKVPPPDPCLNLGITPDTVWRFFYY